jgi:hypothetical protein
MPGKTKSPREYRFEIDAYSPETIPLARLSQYLGDLARMMGETDNVHFLRIEGGSTVPVIAVEWEAEPKVQERLRAVKFSEEGAADAQRAYRELNKKLVEDNATGALIGPSRSNVLKFPGRAGASQPEFGPIRQYGTFQGIPIRIGGELNDVPIHLEDGDETHIVSAPRRIAKQIGPHLFTSVVRVEGIGRWIRDRFGNWEMLGFYVHSFDALKEGDIRKSISRLRAVPAEWKQHEDPISELMAFRTGERPQ